MKILNIKYNIKIVIFQYLNIQILKVFCYVLLLNFLLFIINIHPIYYQFSSYTILIYICVYYTFMKQFDRYIPQTYFIIYNKVLEVKEKSLKANNN